MAHKPKIELSQSTRTGDNNRPVRSALPSTTHRPEPEARAPRSARRGQTVFRQVYCADRDSTKECSSCPETRFHWGGGSPSPRTPDWSAAAKSWVWRYCVWFFSIPDSALAGKPAPPSGWTAVALNTDSNIEFPRRRHQRRGRRRGMAPDSPPASGLRFCGRSPAQPSRSISWPVARRRRESTNCSRSWVQSGRRRCLLGVGQLAGRDSSPDCQPGVRCGVRS